MKVLLFVSLFIVGCSPRWGDYWHLDAEVRDTSMPEVESPYVFDDAIISDATSD